MSEQDEPFEPSRGRLLSFPEKLDPHLSGMAQCLGCQHRWAAVAPIGTFQIQCPQCSTLKGVWTYPAGLPDGTARWTCVCGNDLFFVLADRLVCGHCALTHAAQPTTPSTPAV